MDECYRIVFATGLDRRAPRVVSGKACTARATALTPLLGHSMDRAKQHQSHP